jgi:hypothetical protein
MNKAFLTRHALVIEYHMMTSPNQWVELVSDRGPDIELMCLITLIAYYANEALDFGGPEDGSRDYSYN